MRSSDVCFALHTCLWARVVVNILSNGFPIYTVNVNTGAVLGAAAGIAGSYHVVLDASGTFAWTSGIPGQLARVPLYPALQPGVSTSIQGDSPDVTSLAFTPSGTVYFT